MLCELLYIAVGALFYEYLISKVSYRDPVLLVLCILLWPAVASCLLLAEFFEFLDSPDCEFDNNSDDNPIELEYFYLTFNDEDN